MHQDGQLHEDLSATLLALYRGADDIPATDFQAWALALVQQLVHAGLAG